MPASQTFLLSWGSRRTSLVPYTRETRLARDDAQLDPPMTGTGRGHTMACSAKARISLMARGARFLKLTPWHYIPTKKLQLVFRPNAIW